MRASKWLVLLSFLLPLAAYPQQDNRQLAAGSEEISRGAAVGIMLGWSGTIIGSVALIALLESGGTKGPSNTTAAASTTSSKK